MFRCTQRSLWVILGTAAIAAVMVMPAFGEGGEGAAQSARLTERLDAMEKLVLRDPYHPADTMLARLIAIEERLKELDKLKESEDKTARRAQDERQNQLKENQKVSEQFERRLKELELQLKKGASGSADELKELRGAVDQQQKMLDEFKARLGRLEGKVR